MRENNINWVGNRVLDPNTQRQNTRNTRQNETTTQEQMPSTQAPSTQERPRQTLNQSMDQGPPRLTDINYIPGYLQSIIGQGVRAEFILGNTIYLDKTGVLKEVGVNYFILEDFISGGLVMCDLYSVKFVTTV